MKEFSSSSSFSCEHTEKRQTEKKGQSLTRMVKERKTQTNTQLLPFVFATAGYVISFKTTKWNKTKKKKSWLNLPAHQPKAVVS